MLAKLLVILGVFAAVSLGQAPDCKVIPPMKEMCCKNIIEDPNEEEVTPCFEENKAYNDSDQFLCAVNTCIMKKQNLLNSDNTVNIPAFVKSTKQYLKEISPSVETALLKCFAETEKSECMPNAFPRCFHNALIKECPSTLWLKTEECTNVKKFFVDCPNANIFY